MRAIVIAVLAAGCSAGTHPAESPAAPAEPPATGQLPGDGGTASSSARPAYHLINLGAAAYEWSVPAAMAPNGLVLVRASEGTYPYTYYAVDPRLGERRFLPPLAEAINSKGVAAGLRETGCNQFEVYLVFENGTTRNLGSPRPDPSVGPPCQLPPHSIAGIDDQMRVAVTWWGSDGWYPYLWDGEWHLLAPGRDNFISALAGNGIAVGGNNHDVLRWKDDVATDLGPGQAFGVNSFGAVAGGRQDWTPIVWSGTTAIEMPLLPARDAAFANAINDAYDVAGGESGTGHGILWADHETFDVNDLLDSHLLLVTEVNFIGADRMLVGRALDANGRVQAFAAVPTGAPLVTDRSWRDHGQPLARDERAVAVALDDDFVYWIAKAARRSYGAWQIRRAPKRGGASTTLAEGNSSDYAEGPLAIAGGQAYFHAFNSSTNKGGLVRVPLAGGPVESIAESFVQFAVDERNLYRRATGGALIARAHTGGPDVVLDTADGSGVAAEGGEVIYGVHGSKGGTLRLISRDGGAPVDLFTPVSWFEYFDDMKADSNWIYVAVSTKMHSGFVRVARKGGAPEDVPRAAAYDLAAGEIFRAKPFTEDVAGLGCVSRGGTCLDSGPFQYTAVRAEPGSVYFIRDHDIVRVSY